MANKKTKRNPFVFLQTATGLNQKTNLFRVFVLFKQVMLGILFILIKKLNQNIFHRKLFYD